METIGLVLGLVKVALEVFQDERRDRYLKKYLALQKEFQDEMAKPDDERSDLALDKLVFECKQLGKLIVSEHSGK